MIYGLPVHSLDLGMWGPQERVRGGQAMLGSSVRYNKVRPECESCSEPRTTPYPL